MLKKVKESLSNAFNLLLGDAIAGAKRDAEIDMRAQHPEIYQPQGKSYSQNKETGLNEYKGADL